MRWFLLGALLLIAVPAQAGVLWFSGVESGGLGEFSQVDTAGNANTLCSTSVSGCSTASCTNLLTTPQAPHAGCYALGTVGSATLPGFGVSKKGLNLTTAYVRFYLRILNFGTSALNLPVSVSTGAAQTPLIALMLKTTHTLFWCFGSQATGCTAIATGATVLTTGVWYLVELKEVIHASAGGLELKINGAVEFSSLATNTSGTNIDQQFFGPTVGDVNNSVYYAFDDLAISDTGYVGAGQTIARQGTSGTPTYNTWTKTSCTGGTIDGCWSNTPFTTGSNANSATATNAQTMIVSGFGTTQTGHGSETLQGGEPINACSAAMIAKSGTASAPLSIRRRISGVDTDTAKTLTTTDAYYDDQPWTTTAAILRGTPEIGVVHGTGTATDTVEDMWLFCDYSAATPVKHRVNFD